MPRDPEKNKASKPNLSHIDEAGKAQMVDITNKPASHRRATASAQLTVAPETLHAIQDNRLAKGDVIATARLAGIMGAKKTADLIPLCHPLPLSSVHVVIDLEPPNRIRILATAQTFASTGVEMEALTAANIAALTIYDMTKAIDRAIEIGPVRLEHKQGGRRGVWQRDDSC
ncbi:MAG: cyclic pyranopterin monophosphate synthase MoaC [Pseudomonadota bacterium]